MNLIGRVGDLVPKFYHIVKDVAVASPYIIFGDAAQGGVQAVKTVTKGANESWATVVKKVVKKFVKGIKDNVTNIKSKQGTNFFKAFWSSIKEIPSIIKTATRTEYIAAKAAGKSGIWGGIKGFFKGIGKKMPLIGNILLVAFQLSNIFKATKEQGIGQGVAEVVKTGTRLTAASIASAIGTAVAGPIGGIAGFVIGDWLTSKIVGKSYTEKQAAEMEKDAQALERVQRMQNEGRMPQSVTTQTVTFTGNNSNPFANPNISNAIAYNYGADSLSNPYANDIMMQNMKFNTIV